jgi:hypothetical protein
MTEHLDYDSLRADTVRQVAKLMAAAAITAPKSGGQLLLAGKHLFIETVIVDDRETLSRLAAWMRARGKERRESDLVPRRRGRRGDRRRPVRRPRRLVSARLRLRRLRLRHLRRVPARHQTTARRIRGTRVRRAAVQPPRHRSRDRRRLSSQDRRHPLDRRPLPNTRRRRRPQLGVIKADIAVALSLSLTHKAAGFDRRMPDVDFDNLELPPTGTLPLGVPDAGREGGARNRQQPRRSQRKNDRPSPEAG